MPFVVREVDLLTRPIITTTCDGLSRGPARGVSTVTRSLEEKILKVYLVYTYSFF